MPPKIKSKYNNVYIPADLRDYLEKIVVEIGYRRGRQISASAVVQYLIVTYGNDVRKHFISQTDYS